MHRVLPRVGPLAFRDVARTQYAIRDVQVLDQTSEIAVRCETREGDKKSKMIGTKKLWRKSPSEDLEQRPKAFALKQQE